MDVDHIVAFYTKTVHFIQNKTDREQDHIKKIKLKKSNLLYGVISLTHPFFVEAQ